MTEHVQINDVTPRIIYVANGAQAAFTFPFAIFKAADLEVYLDGVKQLAGFTVTGAVTTTGGSATFTVAPGAGVQVALRRKLSLARTSDYQADGIIRAKTLNDELDYQVAATQQVAEEAGRAVKRSPTSPSTADLTLPDPVAGKAIGWNADGTGLVNDPADFAATLATVTAQANAAIAARIAADADAAQVSVDRLAVASDKATVAADKVIVASDKDAVAGDTAATHTDRLAADASAGAAATSEANALAYRDTAQASATTATTAEAAALTYRNTAQASAMAAAASEANAAASAAAAAVSAASLPNGPAIGAGNVPQWNGAAWQGTNVGIGDLVAANNLSDLTDPAAARGNLDFVEAAQDVVGAMVAAAGGSYDDGSGTIAFPVAAGGGGRNLLIGGDFTTNPWQRGTFFSGFPVGVTYTADRWFVYVTGAAAGQVSQDVATGLAEFPYGIRVGRQNAATQTVYIPLCQVLETAVSRQCAGKSVTLSFHAKKGVSFSSSSSAITVRVRSGKDNDNIAANFIGNWTGATNVVDASQALTTSYVKYSFTGTVPADATQIGVEIGFTPTGTAGSTDYFVLAGVQLEVGSSATDFEHINPALVRILCRRYFHSVNPGGTRVLANGRAVSSTVAAILFHLPTEMRAVPSWAVTDATKFMVYPSSGAAITLTSLGTDTAMTDRVSMGAIVSSGLTAGAATQLIITNGGFIKFDAEL